MASEIRTGPQGGALLVLQLDCGHDLWSGAGRRSRIPKTVRCLACAEPVLVGCLGGCGATADAKTRATRWVFFRAWWCLSCAARELPGILASHAARQAARGA